MAIDQLANQQTTVGINLSTVGFGKTSQIYYKVEKAKNSQKQKKSGILLTILSWKK